MHGRLKVRTSAEEAARKKEEQQQKAKAYQAAMVRILKKKDAAEYDDEMMQLVASILTRNPDVSTLWNIRRLCLLELKQREAVDIKTVFDKDLGFVEQCLHANPKSYCAWHHRCWVLENSPEPNWQREVALCTKYLKMDERNFHVWDYRRYVVEKANVPAKDELDFCTEKIQNNFSNYSSWHARTKLLPILYPNEENKSRPISEEVLRDELELVLTAAFTDPNDSSAWFYQRWLLGYSAPELDIAAFKLTKTCAVASFTKPVNLYKCSLSLDSNTKFDTKKWQPVNTSDTNSYDTIWTLEDVFELNSESNAVLDLDFIDESGQSHTLPIKKQNNGLFGIKMPKFGYEFGSSVLDVLKEQLSSCKQLLEFEPDSKWTLLTAALLMRAIDRKQFHAEALQHIESLKKYDALRVGYYIDLANKWSIEHKLDEWITSIHSGHLVALDLSHLNLVSLHYEQYLCVADEIYLTQNLLSGNRRAQRCLADLEHCNVRCRLDNDAADHVVL